MVLTKSTRNSPLDCVRRLYWLEGKGYYDEGDLVSPRYCRYRCRGNTLIAEFCDQRMSFTDTNIVFSRSTEGDPLVSCQIGQHHLTPVSIDELRGILPNFVLKFAKDLRGSSIAILDRSIVISGFGEITSKIEKMAQEFAEHLAGSGGLELEDQLVAA